MHLHRLPDESPNRVTGIERRERVLEDHLHPRPQGPQLALGEPRDVAAVEGDPARRWLVETEDRPSDRRLAAAGLSDEADGLAAANRQCHAVHRLHVADVTVEHDSALDRKPDPELVELD